MTLIEERPPDLLLLDWMLPQLSGLELCRRLRRRADTAHLPIIMLTARGEEPDRLRGLDTGADDFISKPFSPAELIARIRAVLRRVRPAFAEQLLSFHDLRMDLAAHRVHRGDREIHLSPTEFRLLRHFLEHPGPRVQPRPAARPGLGLRPGDRAAHGRRHDPPAAPGAQRRRRARPAAHGARRGLLARPQVREPAGPSRTAARRRGTAGQPPGPDQRTAMGRLDRRAEIPPAQDPARRAPAGPPAAAAGAGAGNRSGLSSLGRTSTATGASGGSCSEPARRPPGPRRARPARRPGPGRPRSRRPRRGPWRSRAPAAAAAGRAPRRPASMNGRRASRPARRPGPAPRPSRAR